jgi:hypothetical protein
MVSANAEKSVKNIIIMGLLRKKSIKNQKKIYKNLILKDFYKRF